MLQVDQEKAFDKTDQNFLHKTMTKMGFSLTFIEFIKIIYRNNTSTIISNGYFSSPIQIQRGLRQGCPLSPPLYVIQGEIITININQDKTIKGIKIPNYTKEIKVSQYADDSNFHLKEEKSTENVLNYFQQLQKATGATIKLEN